MIQLNLSLWQIYFLNNPIVTKSQYSINRDFFVILAMFRWRGRQASYEPWRRTYIHPHRHLGYGWIHALRSAKWYVLTDKDVGLFQKYFLASSILPKHKLKQFDLRYHSTVRSFFLFFWKNWRHWQTFNFILLFYYNYTVATVLFTYYCDHY